MNERKSEGKLLTISQGKQHGNAAPHSKPKAGGEIFMFAHLCCFANTELSFIMK